mgnify:CR=1 FL=1
MSDRHLVKLAYIEGLKTARRMALRSLSQSLLVIRLEKKIADEINREKRRTKQAA